MDFQTICLILNYLCEQEINSLRERKQQKAEEEDIDKNRKKEIDHSLQLTINSNCYIIKNKCFSNKDLKKFITQESIKIIKGTIKTFNSDN